MAVERTFCIIKPDAIEKRKGGAILALLEENGFSIVALKKLQLSKAVAEGFYAIHKERGFFAELITFMTRAPVYIAVLEREDAVAKNRAVMGATDPAKAEAGTIRKLHGADVGENAVHGSDSPQSAATEIPYFFNALELAGGGR